MSLTYEERRKTILAQLATQGKVQVQMLADHFQVSTETIRRDLDRLEKKVNCVKSMAVQYVCAQE